MSESRAASRSLLGWGLLAAVGLVVFGFFSYRVTERGRFALPYSSYGAGPDGTRALFQLLSQEGFEVQAWSEDIGRMPPGGALLILGGCDHTGSRPMSRPEHERVRRWVERGGTLIVAGASGYVTPELGASLRTRSFEDCLEDRGLVSLLRANEEANEEASEETPSDRPPPVAPPGATDDPVADKPTELLPDPSATLEALDEGLALAEPTWGVPAAEPLLGLPLLGMRNAGAIELHGDARVLASTGPKVGIVEITRGEGHVVVLASASLFLNRDLVEHGGALVMTRLLRHYVPGGVVRFDEYHVGAGEHRSMARYLTQAGVLPLLLQVLFGFALLFFARGRRFGGVRAPFTPPRSSTTAFVGGLAGLFRASKDRAGTLAILGRAGLRRIATAHGQTWSAQGEARAAEELGKDAQALAAALDERGRKAAAQAAREVGQIASRSVPASGDLAKASRDIDAAVERAIARET